MNNRSVLVLSLTALLGLTACSEAPKAFSAAMEPVVLADHSVQQTAVGQVDNGCFEGRVTQMVTYHQPRGSHSLKPVAAGTAATDGGCVAVVAALGAVAAAKVGAGDVISNANAGSISISEAEANVNGGGKPNY